ncbi:hypothetical protein [Neorhodopirellula lusitana]|uniref:hypothetical protein n=1 Tax=Neorhodopirellula lusitana TaxID=445327 RepID=UPI00384F9C9A
MASTGKTVDELKQREEIFRKVRWYEHVYLQSQDVHLLLSGDTEKQWKPDETPTLQITATNYRSPRGPHGDNRAEVELGRTHQAFDYEVDGQWYRMGTARSRSPSFTKFRRCPA